MRAVVYRRYGPPEVLHLEEVETPTPGEDEVLVRVGATSLNSWDYELLIGTPFANRMLHGLLRPQRRILGSDVAGRVEALGSKAGKFSVGDEVFGDLSGRWGGLAEYVCAPESMLSVKPPGLTDAQAAALPQAGLLALQGLTEKRPVKPGDKVLVNGAGGGAGTFAVQIARSLGAEVTGVDTAEKSEVMSAAGAGKVIDYTRQSLTEAGRDYDLIVDFSCHRSVLEYMRLLADGGTYVVVGGATGRILQTVTLAPWIGRFSNKKVGLLVATPNKGMQSLLDLVQAGTVTAVIDRTYTLDEAPDALRYLGEGHARGKVMVRV